MAKKILIAEDEPDIAQMLAVRLEDHGFEVVIVHTGPEALSKARTEKPDLMLIDYTLPKLKGDIVCRELKNDPLYAHIPIILLSAYRKDQISEADRADFYISKPYEAEPLIQKIEELIAEAK
ncbi:MAG: response regulator [Candidatus Omnitrophica bacterium]|nr:response regulator [Candidatus Omnitrophota bacterium]